MERGGATMGNKTLQNMVKMLRIESDVPIIYCYQANDIVIQPFFEIGRCMNVAEMFPPIFFRNAELSSERSCYERFVIEKRSRLPPMGSRMDQYGKFFRNESIPFIQGKFPQCLAV